MPTGRRRKLAQISKEEEEPENDSEFDMSQLEGLMDEESEF